MPDLMTENWYGMVAPAGTPAAIVATLNKIATEAMHDPAVKEKLASQGATLVGDTPEHFRDFIDTEIGKWAKVIKDAGVRRRSETVSFGKVTPSWFRHRHERRLAHFMAGHDAPFRLLTDCYCAALRRCSTNCFAGRGSVLKLRAQITSLRFAQASRIRIIAIGIDCAQRFAAASGTTAMPTSAATIWQIASKSRNRARMRKRTPSRAACLAIWACKRGRIGQPDEIAAVTS